jgi:cytochrome c peroxidase
MHGGARATTEAHVRDLVAYLETLTPAPGIARARASIDPELLAVGRRVFQERGCAECHAPPLYTSSGTFDVGLGDSEGPDRRGEFNPPSLLGVSQRAPYFHDNRATTLSDVLQRFQHGDTADLSEPSRAALLAFLESL